MDGGFTKLSSSIITSSIWCEDDKTRIVWITLLALADRLGDVAGTAPGIAKAICVTVDLSDQDEKLLCFTCDPYPPQDAVYRLSRRAIQILHEHGLCVQVLTKVEKAYWIKEDLARHLNGTLYHNADTRRI